MGERLIEHFISLIVDALGPGIEGTLRSTLRGVMDRLRSNASATATPYDDAIINAIQAFLRTENTVTHEQREEKP